MTADNRKPLIPQAWLRIIVFIVVYIAMVLAIGILAGVLLAVWQKKYGGQADVSRNSLIYLLSFLTAAISFGLVWLFTKFVDRRSFDSIGLSMYKNLSNALTGLFLGIFLLCAGTVVLYYTGHLHWTGINFSWKDLFIGLGLMLIIAFSEELVFRGYILGNLLQSMNKWTAWAVSSVLFAVAHTANPNFSILSAVNILLAGLLLGLNYIYTRNLWFSIALHFAWNFLQGPVLGYEVSGLSLQSLLQQNVSGNELISGGKFGFEGSAIATLFQLLAVIALVAVYQKKFFAGKPGMAGQDLG